MAEPTTVKLVAALGPAGMAMREVAAAMRRVDVIMREFNTQHAAALAKVAKAKHG